MNKKVNTALFILGATVVNILIMIILLVIGLAILARILPADAQGQGGQIAFMFVFLLAIAGSFFIYNRIIKLISKKIDMDKYFHPIFKTGRKGDKPQ